MPLAVRKRIDAYTHILPDKYRELLYDKTQSQRKLVPIGEMKAHHDTIPGLCDTNARIRMIDGIEDLHQVLTLVTPPLEMVVSPADAVELSKIANNEIAGLIDRHPDRFIAGAACLPLNNIDNALKEAERAIRRLGFRGIQMYSPCGGKPLDSPEILPIYQLMSEFDLPIWLHPFRSWDQSDYNGETHSLYRVFHIFGWPFETTAAMARLVFSGVFERFPSLKIITHHCGAMVPYFSERLGRQGQSMVERQEHFAESTARLSKSVKDSFKNFYADTAIDGNTDAFMCAYNFFGPDHILFGTDMPFPGASGLVEDIAAVEAMAIPDVDKQKIFDGNARKLLHL
jgi:aminocarboxymuconate-semialdehyde decarboxylase